MKKLVSLGLITLSALFLTACSNGSQEKTTDKEKVVMENKKEETKPNAKVSEPQNKKYKLGDKLTFENGLEITVTNAEFTDERNEFDDSNPEKVLKVTYNVTNNTKEDYLVSSEMELYVGSNKMNSYPIDTTVETLSPGRSYDNAVAAFGVNGSGKMELEVKPTLSFEKERFIVELDLQ
ncbi:DUF4352 domain-containing protein [Streptococcus dysgalactiae]|uniref:DUF4352 domain-containing protein n=1 Tax=Streptococcus dysgalactiae TaxID=1334 RepID=UPI001CF36529|nr:DUF4352 domain-containing protein [Streptococcus dysgalactiae]MCB2828908.1 DUF4352 domain-containing protein [Streptococcus dysgalactiae subsp. dysgalactiae]MCB2842777.1 DUF4352 domain-containing protein [Streptococcus dysgalactiae subsp. dysgalactiae]MCB2849969.1 DUF4352 domain-containing protein [Streptococcus dysgalactiae subsp. dysgalactiae]